MELQQTLANWDGKTAVPLEELYDQAAAMPDFIPTLLPLIASENTQSGATWLLKHHVAQGNQLSSAIIAQIYALLPQQVWWDAKLHLLQCLPYWVVPKTAVSTIHTFLHQCLKEQNKFVRAWAYNGFYELARQHAQYQTECKILLAHATQEEAASIKARIRKIYKADAKNSTPFLGELI